MHILYFHQHFSTLNGATGTRSYEMARFMVEQGHQVTMVCGSNVVGSTGVSGDTVNGVRRGIFEGINVVEIVLPYSNKDNFLKRSITFLKYALKSIRIALFLKYDLVFATTTPLTAGIPGIFAKIFRRKKFVFEVRDLWPELPREMGVIRNPLILKAMDILEWCSYHAADFCIALSPGIKDGIKKRNIPDENISIIPNGCDLTLFTPGLQSEKPLKGVNENDFIAVFTGAHGIANGLDAILDAAKKLQEKERDDIKLIFIGDGKLKPHLLERKEKEQLRNCLFFPPVPKNQLAKVLSNADVGLMVLKNIPAFYYGTSPNKFFDYISSGLPVLNNYPGWLSSMIEKYKCGMSIPPDDPVLFSDALIRMADDPVEMRNFKENARVLAEKQFDRATLAEKFKNVLLSVYANNN